MNYYMKHHMSMMKSMALKNGKRDGISKTYNMNGQLLNEEMWVNDCNEL